MSCCARISNALLTCRRMFLFVVYLGVYTFLIASAHANTFSVNARGQVYIAEEPNPRGIDSLVAETNLLGCKMLGEVRTQNLDRGGVEYRKEFRQQKEGHQCSLIERFIPTDQGIHWEIEVRGHGAPWSTAIETNLQWKQPDALTWWAAWGDSQPDAQGGVRKEASKEVGWWSDPLVPASFARARFFYGGQSHAQTQAFCIPMVSVLDAKIDKGISLVLSPKDLILNLEVNVTAEGKMTLSRTSHRMTADQPVRFSMDLIWHEADWRSGLGWMATQYPQFFDPPNARVQQMAGCGAYSSHARDLNVERLRRMAFKMNWKASFDFPYMGMFIPPVPDATTEWIDFKSKPTSISRMRQDIRCFTDNDFHVLCYFNVTEFGNYIQYPPPARKAVRDEDLWKDPNDYVYSVLKDAILTRAGEGKPIGSWEGCIAMDPGDPVYQRFLVEQAKRHVELLPGSSGICIDRMDWLRFYNPRFDDGVSWANGKPARSLVTSWHEIIPKISAVMHDNNKVIYCNPHYRRLDLVRHIDGIYDEFGQMGHSMNLCALLALRKPIMAWTIMVPEFEQAPDEYFQRHLHMGAYLTVPMLGNDHTILPSENVDQMYFDYAPLLEALQGKQWVLASHAVAVADNTAKANLFEVPGGYVVPVTFGGESKQARVVLRHLHKQSGQDSFQAQVIHPGRTDWTPLMLKETSNGVTIEVPLERGCAMVKIY
ncbi:MAG: hypothetical protein HQ515_18460 [Phycisphaeraceae bacterium]|nr:hypothetical protein [Phycisphaeraceae bacterium]